ncbi:uncharacterized protein LOC128225615 [Mya arenaria]|uniref:uncharacterized protein LOC128225614 n=1 Tax=Mya arenaria TaxID=6604 RepID=UPI0022E60751|nr:uncharacterized protein LOC128225614 [Mya arenaria]XP_052791469.1 uncharacterized protein LOC128225615 [Mya arenaria]
MSERASMRPQCEGSEAHKPDDAHALCNSHGTFLCIQCLIEKRHLEEGTCSVVDLRKLTSRLDRARIQRLVLTQMATRRLAQKEDAEQRLEKEGGNVELAMETALERLKEKLTLMKDQSVAAMAGDIERRLAMPEVRKERDALGKLKSTLQASIDALLVADKTGADISGKDLQKYRDQEKQAALTLRHLKKDFSGDIVARFDLSPSISEILSGRIMTLGKAAFDSSHKTIRHP